MKSATGREPRGGREAGTGRGHTAGKAPQGEGGGRHKHLTLCDPLNVDLAQILKYILGLHLMMIIVTVTW